ncbi:MAG: ATP-binding protein [Gammaproteobacteria bacterium]|nr:ATP-binding protein [Gammaproteobacteria bacterium]
MTFKPATIIISGFTLVICMIIIFLVVSLYQLNSTRQALEFEIKTESMHISATNSLLEIDNKRSILILNILQADEPFAQDEVIQQFYNQGEEFIKIRQTLLDSRLSDFEIQLLANHQRDAENVAASQHQIIKLISEGRYEPAHHIYMTQALPKQQNNNSHLNLLSQYQHHEIDMFLSSLTKKQNDIYLIILAGSIFLIILCILIALFIYRKLSSNIYEIQQARDELTSSLAETRDLQYALDQHAIVSISDTSGKITYVNEKFCEVSQYSEAELIGKHHNIINSGYHQEAFFHEIWTTILSGKTWNGEIRNRKKDGQYYWVETSIIPFLDNDNKPYQYIAIRTEITHIKAIEKELLFTLEQLAVEAHRAQESNTLKDSIISTMTHELRTPLNSILGFSQLLLMEKSMFSDIQTDNIECIINSGKELLANIDNIMLYSTLKSNSLALQLCETDVSGTIHSAINSITSKQNALTITPQLQTTNQPTCIRADNILLRKALEYVIDNAIKFTRKGHIKINYYDIARNTAIPGHHKNSNTDLVLITIEDTGVGISPEKSQIIFDDFRQADEKVSRYFEGMGIGLSLAKSIINLHKGEIWLTSELEKGTTVYITIPKKLDA